MFSAAIIAAVNGNRKPVQFTALDLPSPIAWWDAGSLSGSYGQDITAVPDSVAGIYPLGGHLTFRNGTLGGRNMMEFDGTNFLQTAAGVPVFPAKRGAIFAVYRKTTTATEETVVATYNQPSPNWLAYGSSASPFRKWFDGAGGFSNSVGDWVNEWQYQAWIRTGDTSMEFYRNGVLETTMTIADNQPAIDITYLAGNTSGPDFHGQIAEIVITGAVPSSAQRAKFDIAMARRYNMRQIITLGDSLTQGYGSNDQNVDSYPALLRGKTSHWTNVVNAGFSGYTTADLISGFASQVTGNLNHLMRRHTAIVWIGTNDLVAGTTPADAYANLVTYVGMLRGEDIEDIVLITPLPRSGVGVPADFETLRQTYRSLILNGGLTPYIADVGGNPLIGQSGDENGPNYIGDSTHLNPFGYEIVAQMIGAVINL